MNPIKINKNAVIVYGPLKGIKGKVIAANYADGLVTLETEGGAQIIIDLEVVSQEGET